MRKCIRAVLLTLVAALLFTAAVPVTAFAARPKSFDESRLNQRNASFQTDLKIGDMTFKGTLTNKAVDDVNLDKLIEQALSEIGMSADELDNLDKGFNQGISPEEADDIIAALAAALGLTDADSIDIFSIYQLFDQLERGDTAAAYNAYLDMIKGENAGNPENTWRTILAIYNDPGNSSAAGRRKQAEFYDRLHDMVQKELDKIEPKWVMEIKNATDKKPFNFYAMQYEEKWTVNMDLKMVTPHENSKNKPGWAHTGVYEGSFTIDIEYDYSRVGADFRNIGRPCWADQSDFAFETTVMPNVTSSGTNSVKRIVEGKARLYIDDVIDRDFTVISNGAHTDKKDVKMSGITVQMHSTLRGSGGASEITLGYGISADDVVFNVVLESSEVYSHLSWFAPVADDIKAGFSVGSSLNDPWVDIGNMWERCDKAMENVSWNLRLK